MSLEHGEVSFCKEKRSANSLSDRDTECSDQGGRKKQEKKNKRDVLRMSKKHLPLHRLN